MTPPNEASRTTRPTADQVCPWLDEGKIHVSISITVIRDDQQQQHVVDTGTTGLDLFGRNRDVVAMRIAGTLLDLQREIQDGDVVEPVLATSQDGLNIIRHSCTHVMAQAVQELYPDVNLGIGPFITDGFYYDFDVAQPFTPEDLKTLEKRMKKIIKQGQKFERRVYADQAEAAEALKNEPYKLELIADKGSVDPQSDEATEVGAGELTGYYNLNPRTKAVEWYDLCRGPHVPTTKYIPAFALTRSSAAYWRGDQANAGLQRIYGTAWESPDALAEYQHKMAEAEKRDHRRLGQELDLFSFPDEIGSGLPVFHPDGGIVRMTMEQHSRERHVAAEGETTCDLAFHAATRADGGAGAVATVAPEPAPAQPLGDQGQAEFEDGGLVPLEHPLERLELVERMQGEAQQVLGQHLEAVGQRRGALEALDVLDAVDLVLVAADREGRLGSEAVAHNQSLR